MSTPVFIGDEVTAGAYRLAGLDTRVPGPVDVRRLFDEAREEAELIVLSAEAAAAIPAETLREAVRRADPLVVVAPDGGLRFMPEDLDERVDRVLGIER